MGDVVMAAEAQPVRGSHRHAFLLVIAGLLAAGGAIGLAFPNPGQDRWPALLCLGGAAVLAVLGRAVRARATRRLSVHSDGSLRLMHGSGERVLGAPLTATRGRMYRAFKGHRSEVLWVRVASASDAVLLETSFDATGSVAKPHVAWPEAQADLETECFVIDGPQLDAVWSGLHKQ